MVFRRQNIQRIQSKYIGKYYTEGEVQNGKCSYRERGIDHKKRVRKGLHWYPQSAHLFSKCSVYGDQCSLTHSSLIIPMWIGSQAVLRRRWFAVGEDQLSH